MTSFGAKEIREGGFMPTFKIQGQIYHNARSLLSLSDEAEKFLQIYFIEDAATETDRRCQTIPDVNRDIVLKLQQLMHKNNALIKVFETALENMSSDNYAVVIKVDKIPTGEHGGRFNAPTINEVGVVIVG